VDERESELGAGKWATGALLVLADQLSPVVLPLFFFVVV